jgi:hypothetical protein
VSRSCFVRVHWLQKVRAGIQNSLTSKTDKSYEMTQAKVWILTRLTRERLRYISNTSHFSPTAQRCYLDYKELLTTESRVARLCWRSILVYMIQYPTAWRAIRFSSPAIFSSESWAGARLPICRVSVGYSSSFAWYCLYRGNIWQPVVQPNQFANPIALGYELCSNSCTSYNSHDLTCKLNLEVSEGYC